MRAIGLVRAELPAIEASVAAVRSAVPRWGLELTGVLVRSGDGIARALAQLDAETQVIVVPSEPHLRGWMNAATQVAAVWAIESRRCWPRENGRPQPIPRPGHTLAIGNRR